jgi:formylmethanofuran dehydrogenase subunit B
MSPAGGPQTQQEFLVEHATCLGCGCACDDITVQVRGCQIVDARNACALGLEWFGDGEVPAAIRVDDRDATLDQALDAVRATLVASKAPLIYIAPDLSCEAQREAVALADLLHASIDTITSGTALSSILASQERGRASATLSEIRNRADVLVFWGVDPNARYPRYWSRYAPEPAGLHVTNGRQSRKVIAVDVGGSRGPEDADIRMAVPALEEVATLTAVDAVVRGRGVSDDGDLWRRARGLAAHLTGGRYVVLVADGEPPSRPGDDAIDRDPQRSGALIAVAQGLNGPTRCALSTLRAGGNRSGADAVLTAHTGYPTGVTFSHGFPIYRPHDAAAGTDAVLLIGDAAQVPSDVMSTLTRGPLTVIGPRASRQAGAGVAIDTGVAGIHTGGTALRMDDVPLPLRPSISGRRDPVDVLRALITRIATKDGPEDPSLHPTRGIEASRRDGASAPPANDAESGR